ncbi:MAG TPA: BON domain-containing protein [Pyrinomonadaceae bacterium]|nr:BON domain-containing protein [Pyrinomonadaceae bacterium]
MNKALVFGAGLGLGTGLMYLLDPDRGKRRRALLRDKCVSAARKTGEAFECTAHDLRNRSRGIIAEIQSRFSSEPVDDAVLIDRVRSKLGRIVSHPGAIQVTAQNGNVTLAGPILTAEVPELLTCVKSVAGVNDVIDSLELHEEAGNHPALQGGRERQGTRFEFFQENWSPTH